ncbi:hypothetical protein LJR219_003612 [Phenylobacterium sp. LjRoot219]
MTFAGTPTARAAQHLDLADVEHRLEQQPRRDRRLVEIELDGAVIAAGVHVVGDAAQRRAVADAVGVLRQGQARNERLHVPEFPDIELRQFLRRHRLDGQRHVLLAFIPPSRRDDDLIDHARREQLLLGGARRFLGDGRRGERQDADARQGELAECGHCFLPYQITR